MSEELKLLVMVLMIVSAGVISGLFFHSCHHVKIKILRGRVESLENRIDQIIYYGGGDA